MISIMTQDTMEKAAALFSGMKGTMITSCLTGTMGKVYLSDNAAAAYLGDLSLFIGTPDEELLLFKPNEKSSFVIMVPASSCSDVFRWSRFRKRVIFMVFVM